MFRIFLERSSYTVIVLPNMTDQFLDEKGRSSLAIPGKIKDRISMCMCVCSNGYTILNILKTTASYNFKKMNCIVCELYLRKKWVCYKGKSKKKSGASQVVKIPCFQCRGCQFDS